MVFLNLVFRFFKFSLQLFHFFLQFFKFFFQFFQFFFKFSNFAAIFQRFLEFFHSTILFQRRVFLCEKFFQRKIFSQRRIFLTAELFSPKNFLHQGILSLKIFCSQNFPPNFFSISSSKKPLQIKIHWPKNGIAENKQKKNSWQKTMIELAIKFHVCHSKSQEGASSFTVTCVLAVCVRARPISIKIFWHVWQFLCFYIRRKKRKQVVKRRIFNKKQNIKLSRAKKTSWKENEMLRRTNVNLPV